MVIYKKLENADIQLIDGDRGVHYPNKSDFSKSGYCVFLNTGNVTVNGFDFSNIDYISKERDELLRKGKVDIFDIVLTTRGTVGNVAYISGNIPYKNIRINSGMVIVRVNKNEIFPYFLYSFFRSFLFKKQCSSNGSGSAQPQLPISALKNIAFPDFDLKTQQKIANILLTLDRKIALNQQINQKLEAMAKQLYDYWFVQFDFPDENGKPYKSSGGEMVWCEALKREVPKGWEVSTLSTWIGSDKTGDWGKEKEEGNYQLKVDCIRGADINGINGNGKADMPTRFILHKNESKLLLPYEFVIEISGGSPTQSTGRLAGITEQVLERFNNSLICSNFCKAISLNNKDYFFNFMYLWKSIYDNNILFGWEGKTSGIKNLLFDSFVSKYEVVKPSQELAKRFFNIASSIEMKKQKYLCETQKLTQLRDFLLPMLMNGQVSVK